MNDRRTFLGTLLGWLGLGAVAKAQKPLPKTANLWGTVVAHAPKTYRALHCECGSVRFWNAVATVPPSVATAKATDFWWQDCRFHGWCCSCEKVVAWELRDHLAENTDPVFNQAQDRKFHMDGYQYPQFEISYIKDSFTEEWSCIWYVPGILLRLIREGDRHVLAGVPLELIEMARQNKPSPHIFRLNPAVHTVDGRPMTEVLEELA